MRPFTMTAAYAVDRAPWQAALTPAEHSLVFYALVVAGLAIFIMFIRTWTSRNEVGSRYRPALFASLGVVGAAFLSYVVLVIKFDLGYDLRGAGIQLSKATEVLDARLHLVAALGGLIVLAVATNLTGLAITVSAFASGNVSFARVEGDRRYPSADGVLVSSTSRE